MENTNTHFATELAASLKKYAPSRLQKLKLIIHAGTPKTGTTSLQIYLDKKQGKLRRKGILYPHNLEKIKNPTAPKHQWFEKNMVTAHVDNFLDNFKNILSQVTDDTHTILLSSEGIFNYWWDFPEESKVILTELGQLFDTEIWVWFREPLEFIESYYKQCIRNPQVKGNPCYGKDLSFDEMLGMEWFNRHLNYQGFIDDCTATFGKNSVSAFAYEGDVVQAVMQIIGLATPHDNPTPRLNKSLHSGSIAMLRTINRYDIKPKEKAALMPHLKNINEVLENYEDASLISETSRKRVLTMFRPAQNLVSRADS